MSIRARLMILALIAFVPITLERIYSEQFNRRERIEAAHREAIDLARHAIGLQRDVINSTRSLLQALAASNAVSAPSGRSCSPLLKKIAELQPSIKTLLVATPDGKILCSNQTSAAGVDITKRPYFFEVVRSGKFIVSDYFLGGLDTSPLLIAANPQGDKNGGNQSVIVAMLDLGWTDKMTERLAERAGSIMLLVDGKGVVLAREPISRGWAGRNLKDQTLFKRMVAQSEGVVTDSSLDGVRRIFAFVELPGTTAHVVVGFNENEVLGRVDTATWSAFTNLGYVIFCVLVSIWFGAERLLMRPVRALADTARRIGRGEEKKPVANLPWAEEFIPLAIALDDMTEKLEAREQELRDINDQLRELAQLDSLTCLPNRRTFNAHLLAEWNTAVTHRHPIAVLMIDVDHFKPFNDCYGHVRGDACLRKVGEVLKTHTKPRDTGAVDTRFPHNPTLLGRGAQLAARYGGEEFAVLLPGVDLDDAARFGERLRRAVEEMLISHAGAPWGFLSISVGVAAMVPGERDSPQDLTEAADSCLYEAKQRGRNAVVAKSDAMMLVRASA